MSPIDQDLQAGPGRCRPRVLVVGDGGTVTAAVIDALDNRPARAACTAFDGAIGQLGGALADSNPDAVVYLAATRDGGTPDRADAEALGRELVAGGVGHLILVSSQAVNAPIHSHPGMLTEERLPKKPPANRIARRWRELERAMAVTLEGGGTRLTVMRPAPVPTPDGTDFWSRLLGGSRLVLVVAGHDPTLQLLSLSDLGRAIGRAVEAPNSADRPGHQPAVYNLAPRQVTPLRAAIKRSGGRVLALPYWLHRVRGWLMPRAASIDQVGYIRYSSTISGERAAAELGFQPAHTSAEAIDRLRGTTGGEESARDDFGQDKDYIAAKGRTVHRFLFDRYWRVETLGVQHVPESGRAVLTGVHRGFMPFDGVMALEAVIRSRGRHTRFLIHSTLVKFPFLADYLTRLGGMIACSQNADRVLRDEGLLGMFPEGINGAFCYYRDAYRLHRFGRDEFVKMALRNRAPIVPFVTLGSAEIFPIFAKINWRWWKRYTGWPCLPITPTFPLAPLPLPSKWHMRFLEPIHVERAHPPEAAGDPAVVGEISAEVRRRLTEALTDMRERRQSIFSGSIFNEPSLGGEDE